jgi:glyoxylase-like metal-dependent hydrolase (beta-lactamase superfamily II)
MEIMPNIHQIPVNYKNRPLNLYLLLGTHLKMLMDMGENSTPDADILPYLRSLNVDPASLTHVMATHPDLDHSGGIHRMRELAPNAKFVCGTQDRDQIETAEGLADIRARAHYHWHGLGPDDAARQKFIERAGGPGKRVTMAATFDGGETLPFDNNRLLHILHLPGHSHGHLGVYVPWENAAIIGDAVHGTANRFLDGRAAFACTYMYVDAYLSTIDKLRLMKLDKLFSCHWPNCDSNAAVEKFLAESRTYALHAENVILNLLRDAGDDGLTLKDVCLRAKPDLGDWPPEKDTETRSMACGHLQRLVDRGLARVSRERPARYFYEPRWLGLI